MIRRLCPTRDWSSRWPPHAPCVNPLPMPTRDARPASRGSRPRPRCPAAAQAIAGDYLRSILTARVYDVAVETPLEPREEPVAPPGQPGAAQARGHAVGLQLQAARRLQQDGPPGARGAAARRHLRLGRQPRAGRRAGARSAWACAPSIVMPVTTPTLKVDAVHALGGEVVLHGDSYSDAYGHALQIEAGRGPDLRAPVRRSRRHRRPGHRRDGGAAPAPGPDRRGVRGDRRRRPDLRRGRLHQGAAARDQGHRRAGGRLRRDDPVGAQGQARRR